MKKEKEFEFQLNRFTHDRAHPEIPTAWLRERLGRLRFNLCPAVSLDISPKVWSQWRSAIGIKKNAEFCTQQQAALLVLIALWKPGRQSLLKSCLDSKLNVVDFTELSASRMFAKWTDLDDCAIANELLREIQSWKGRYTGEELSRLSGLVLPKQIPVSNLSRSVGVALPASRKCSREASAKTIRWMVARAMRHQLRSMKKNSVMKSADASGNLTEAS